jgi:ligand-binding SRPBCC domain-containing protein
VPTFERTQRVGRPLSEVFAFFADAANLEKLTPAFLHFQIQSPTPIEMRPGALIDYQLRLYGVPLRWRSEIEAFTPGVGFVDVQRRGPYKRWRHTHSFRAVDGGTEIADRVDYALPLWPASIVALPLVRRALRQIFDHRARITAALFA